MDIRGLVLINSEAESGTEPNHFGEVPLALVDVAGKSALMRTAERLRKFGVGPVTAVIEEAPTISVRGLQGEPGLTSMISPRERFWRAAENVILIKLGCYFEPDFDAVIQSHLDHNCRVSKLSYEGLPLEVFCISASRRNDAASLFRTNLSKCRTDCEIVEQNGYFNPLSNACDLRQLAIDILTLQTDTSPAGQQVKPGVWIARGGHVEKGARVIAPAFIGRSEEHTS